MFRLPGRTEEKVVHSSTGRTRNRNKIFYLLNISIFLCGLTTISNHSKNTPLLI